jgi:hypothetical protein
MVEVAPAFEGVLGGIFRHTWCLNVDVGARWRLALDVGEKALMLGFWSWIGLLE